MFDDFDERLINGKKIIDDYFEKHWGSDYHLNYGNSIFDIWAVSEAKRYECINTQSGWYKKMSKNEKRDALEFNDLLEKEFKDYAEEVMKKYQKKYPILESKKSSRKSMKESKEIILMDKVATKLKNEKIIDAYIDTFRGADWIGLGKGDYTIKVIYIRGELSIELYKDGDFRDGELESAYSLSDDDFSVNYVIDFIKKFIKERNYLKKEFSIKESMKESIGDGIKITNKNIEELPSWIFEDNKILKTMDEIVNTATRKNFDVVYFGDVLSGEIYIVNDDIQFIISNAGVNKDSPFCNIVVKNIEKVNEVYDYIARLPYASVYKRTDEIDEFIPNKYLKDALGKILDFLYYWK